MAWRFERVAGPFEGPAAGLAWDGTGMLFSILSRGPRAGETNPAPINARMALRDRRSSFSTSRTP